MKQQARYLDDKGVAKSLEDCHIAARRKLHQLHTSTPQKHAQENVRVSGLVQAAALEGQTF